MNAWKIILATVVIFATGVITGGMLVHYTDASRPRKPGATRPWQPQGRELANAPTNRPAQPAADQKRMMFVLRVQEELRLQPDQKERIEKIVREGQERTQSIWDRVSPELKRNLGEVQDRIRAELTPGQRKRFEELLKKQRALSAAGTNQNELRRTNPGGRNQKAPSISSNAAGTAVESAPSSNDSTESARPQVQQR